MVTILFPEIWLPHENFLKALGRTTQTKQDKDCEPTLFFLLLYNTQEHCLSFVHCTYALDSVLSVCVNAICTKSCAQVFVSTASILPLAWAHFDVSLLCKTRRGTRDTYARHSPLGDEQRRSRRKEGRRERGWGKRVNFPAVSPLTCTKIVSLVTKGRADESPQCARYHWKRSLATS